MANDSLEQSELWDISRRLVGFNTVSALSNVLAAEYIGNSLEDCGFTVRVLRESVEGVEKATVLAWVGPEVAGGLIVSGHTDIVPFEGQPGWTMEPLVMRTDGERIYGRGVTDMKVFLAQMLLAAKQLPLKELKRPLVYIFSCDEEIAGQGSARLLNVLPQIFQGYPLPTVALIGEPTGFAVFPAHKGYATFDIHVRGKGGHSSAPHRGLNAIEKMADVIEVFKEANMRLQQQVSSENARLFPEFPASVFNFGVIAGGMAPNMIAESCSLTTSIRIAPGDKLEDILADVREKIDSTIVKSMRQNCSECGVSIGRMTIVPPMSSPTQDAFCELLCRVMDTQAEMGAPYATDGGQFQRAGIHSYICGPGLLEEAHQPNESMPVRNFFTGLEKLKHTLHEWCIHREAQ
ncbi:MAG TPA: M20 family metallopeptidase [Ktedonobacteraceae bacterium]|nr:M20 family metallopeptidase [Ktedonobacteraceae bacterium]